MCWPQEVEFATYQINLVLFQPLFRIVYSNHTPTIIARSSMFAQLPPIEEPTSLLLIAS